MRGVQIVMATGTGTLVTVSVAPSRRQTFASSPQDMHRLLRGSGATLNRRWNEAPFGLVALGRHRAPATTWY